MVSTCYLFKLPIRKWKYTTYQAKTRSTKASEARQSELKLSSINPVALRKSATNKSEEKFKPAVVKKRVINPKPSVQQLESGNTSNTAVTKKSGMEDATKRIRKPNPRYIEVNNAGLKQSKNRLFLNAEEVKTAPIENNDNVLQQSKKRVFVEDEQAKTVSVDIFNGLKDTKKSKNSRKAKKVRYEVNCAEIKDMDIVDLVGILC